ncbi:pentatricopeptide repeat-containing protein At4g14820-like [Typha latifolia]|uniref:pentatricopeptide repeat-containing protein At4g14820-like n=1 Tax=Typha latifolia TaxID=4733 RepID=UPI003C2ACFF4
MIVLLMKTHAITTLRSNLTFIAHISRRCLTRIPRSVLLYDDELAPERQLHREQRTRKWKNALGAYLEGSEPELVIWEYNRGRSELKVDHTVLLFVIKACGLLLHSFYPGKQVHSHVFKLGFDLHLVVQSALLKMYGFFGDLLAVRKMFDETPHRDVIMWNALVATYSRGNHPQEALFAASAMAKENSRPNEVTVTSALSSCSKLKALAHGKQVHGYAVKNLIGFDTPLQNSLIDMYAKCGCLRVAQKIFEKMGSRTTVSWTCMINAYCENDCPGEALTLFQEMQTVGVRLDKVILLALISICTKLGSSELMKWIDECVEKTGFHEDICVANALINMHSKCGNLEKSCYIFDQMTVRSLITWTTMIHGLAMHGQTVAALVRFSQMQREGFKLDEVVLLNIINACSHARLVMEGRQCFKSMVEEHGITPRIEHYGSMVDLLCRAGLVDEAFEFMTNMPVKPDAPIWRILIGACRDIGNIGLARKVMEYVLELEPEHSGNYIMKSNLHAKVGEWSAVQEARENMELKEATRMFPAQSSIEVNEDTM